MLDERSHSEHRTELGLSDIFLIIDVFNDAARSKAGCTEISQRDYGLFSLFVKSMARKNVVLTV